MSKPTRRDLLGSGAALGGWMLLKPELSFAQRTPQAAQPTGAAGGAYVLPDLPYDYADLEPHIDAQTMTLHHDIHHKGYVDGANVAVAELERIRRTGGDEIKKVRAVTESLAFNASGHVLHCIFWENMQKDGGGDPSAGSEIGRMIVRDFGAVESFRAQFSGAAAQVQGSGWGVLAYEPVSQRLLVLQAEKHQNLGVWGVVPLLVLDVWEHAYYLRYQNKRSDYIKAFMNVVNWDNVEHRLHTAMKLV